MTAPGAWDAAPAGLLALDHDGRVTSANATALRWTGCSAEDLDGRHVSALLTAGAALFWETHVSPLLVVEGRVDELVLELAGPDGPLPVLLSACRTDDGTVLAASSARGRADFERELRQARRSARTSERQVRGLQSVTAALSSAVGVDAVADVLAGASTSVLGASGATVLLTGADGRTTARARRPADLEDPVLPVAPEVPELRDGTVVVPLRGQRVLRGMVVLVPSEAPGAEPVDLDACAAVGQQGGLALDRAWAYEQQADVAAELQRSLLEVDVPQDGRFSVQAVYRPGVEALEVGGDWYDVFAVGPDRVALVVGDVVGRGLAAASAMGQLRSAVRAVAGPDVGPARLLQRLDRFVEQVRAGGMATLAYAELDLADGRLRWSCAGHPPPVLLDSHGRARLLWEGRATPLGALVAPAVRPEGEVQLEAGDRLLLCTDGLFERRGQDLDTGLERLRSALQQHGGEPLAESVHALTTELLADERGRDDVCVLLLGYGSAALRESLPGDLSGLSALRTRLRGWLVEQRVPDPLRSDLVLAASELLANAGEHGADRDPAVEVGLVAQVRPDGDDRQVVLEVRDPGRWQSQQRSDERGRGLAIVHALVDEVDVAHGDDGTRVRVLRRVAGA